MTERTPSGHIWFKKCLNANNFQPISYFTNIAFQNKANYATLLAEAESKCPKNPVSRSEPKDVFVHHCFIKKSIWLKIFTKNWVSILANYLKKSNEI